MASQLALEELETEWALHFLEPEYMKELDTLHISALPKELDKPYIPALPLLEELMSSTLAILPLRMTPVGEKVLSALSRSMRFRQRLAFESGYRASTSK